MTVFLCLSGEPEAEGISEPEIGGDVGLGLTVAVYSLIIIFVVVRTQSQKMYSFVPRAKMNGKVGFHA